MFCIKMSQTISNHFESYIETDQNQETIRIMKDSFLS